MKPLMLSLALAALAAAPLHAAEKAAAPDQAAMMQAWQEAISPNANHKKLEPLIGSWTTKSRMWMEPGAAPTEGEGSVEITWAMDGRFVEQRYRGTFMGRPFSGLGFTGYDNLEKRYVSNWLDNHSTAIYQWTGQFDASGSVLTMTGTQIDPMTRARKATKEVLTIAGKDRFTFELWGGAPGGKLVKEFEIVYTRKK